MTRAQPLALDGTSVHLTPLVLGTMSFGDTVEASTALEIFESAVESGITGIDTANGYAKSTTETLIAPAVARFRDRIVLATKAGMPHADAGDSSPLSAKGLRASVEGSLRRLGVDRIDLFYLHQPDRSAGLAETMGTVAELHAEGKIGALGVSNFAAWQVVDLITEAARAGAPRPAVAQNVYSIFARRIEDEWTEAARTHDVATMVYNPLAGGLLARRPSSAGTPDRFTGSVLADMYRQRYLSETVTLAAESLADIADAAGIPQAELSLRWAAHSPATDALLLGTSTVAQLQSNIAAVAKGPLAADILDAIDVATTGIRGTMPLYNR
ncbi:aldo/keto reductase [Pseudoclavibacter sp. AY1H1]|uniref:aldo/keto reductase n=1 Tax=Pseudoclavibacter sp. AY1H1 TaxID=2080584 RepID=UPI000CE7FF1B|nr:aldo/keto reductase [Pseudoclavibacter sp. AY1H1]PPF34624.1 aldo/keto reductase [Pseudoclavibacter sp. AY1H1]